jgi:hypothetical protein
MKSFLDILIYSFLSLSLVWMCLAFLMLLLRRRKFRSKPRSIEQRFYQGVLAISLIAWVWNGFRPTPRLFEERVGLYWGLKTENITWRIYTGGFEGLPTIAHNGQTSLAVQFQKATGWVIFNHFPTAPQINRYEALEFFVLDNDLRQDPLRLRLYSDGKIPHPPEGLAVNDSYGCDDQNTPSAWKCYRVPLDNFAHPGGGIIGIAFGKGDGVDEGTFYLDDVRLIEKGR